MVQFENLRCAKPQWNVLGRSLTTWTRLVARLEWPRCSNMLFYKEIHAEEMSPEKNIFTKYFLRWLDQEVEC